MQLIPLKLKSKKDNKDNFWHIEPMYLWKKLKSIRKHIVYLNKEVENLCFLTNQIRHKWFALNTEEAR